LNNNYYSQDEVQISPTIIILKMKLKFQPQLFIILKYKRLTFPMFCSYCTPTGQSTARERNSYSHNFVYVKNKCTTHTPNSCRIIQ